MVLGERASSKGDKQASFYGSKNHKKADMN